MPAMLGRYRLGELVGQGGFGFVYSASDETLRRRVAIKLRRNPVSASASDLADLLHEAKTVAQLHHPNVVRVFDVGCAPTSIPELVDVFVVMEFLGGRPVNRWLKENDPLREDVIDVFLQVCDGLTAAHDAGILHCDIKPANIFVTRGGVAKLLDFGLSLYTIPEKELETASGRSGQHPRGGTSKYMAPETHLGLPVDASSDQYSLGVTLIEALTGSNPFAGVPRAKLVNRKNEGISAEHLRKSGVPRSLSKTLERMISPAPEHRFDSVRDVAYELRRWNATSPYWLAAGTLGLVVAGGLALVRPDPPCTPRPDQLVPLVERAEALSKGWATRSPDQATAGARLHAQMNEFSTAWAEAAAFACPDGPAEVRGCLEDGLRGFDALLGTLESSETLLTRAHRLDDVLDAPGKCSQPRTRDPAPPPTSPELRVEVSEIRADLARARARQIGGDYSRALALSRQCLRRASRAGFEPLVAEALLRVGHGEAAAGNSQAAAEYLEQAYLVAQSHRHDRVASKAAVALVDIHGGPHLFSPEAARLWARRANATLSRIGAAQRDRAALEYHLGGLEYELGALDQAAIHFANAAVGFERLGDHHDVAAAELNGGWAELTRGNVARAEELMRSAHTRLREHSGPRHPDTLRAQLGLAGIQNQRHRYEVALANYEYVLEHSREVLPDHHPDLVVMLMGVGHCEFQVGKTEAALAHLREAYSLATRTSEPGDLNIAGALSLLALAQADLGQHEDALEGLQAVLDQYRKVIERPSHQLANAYANVGLELAAVDRHDEASVHFDAAFDCLRPEIDDGMRTSILARQAHAEVLAGTRPVETLRSVIAAFDTGETEPLHASSEFMLAKLLFEEDPQEALALASTAAARFASFGMERKRREVQAWQNAQKVNTR